MDSLLLRDLGFYPIDFQPNRYRVCWGCAKSFKTIQEHTFNLRCWNTTHGSAD